MGSINLINGKNNLFLKGAPEVILKKCSKILINNKILKLTDAKRKEILKINETFADNALRVLGFSYKLLEKKFNQKNEKIDDKNCVFLGLTGMIDPPRKEVKESLQICEKAGIRVVMITGDHKLTAQAIARQI